MKTPENNPEQGPTYINCTFNTYNFGGAPTPPPQRKPWHHHPLLAQAFSGPVIVLLLTHVHQVPHLF